MYLYVCVCVDKYEENQIDDDEIETKRWCFRRYFNLFNNVLFDVNALHFFCSSLCLCECLTGERERERKEILFIHCFFFICDFYSKITTKILFDIFIVFFSLLHLCCETPSVFFSFFFKISILLYFTFLFSVCLFVYVRMIRSRWYRNTRENKEFIIIEKNIRVNWKDLFSETKRSCFHSLDQSRDMDEMEKNP